MSNTLLLKIYNSISDFKPARKTVATLGTFDGVHSGHRKIMNRLVASATECDCESVVLTFFPHPRMVLSDDAGVKLLNTIDEKAALLSQTGLDNLIVHPFDAAFSQLSAEEFVKTVLVQQLNIHKIIIGHDHRFGRNRTADINDLIRYGESYGFEVEQITAEEVDDVAISSTKIRNALNKGDVTLANQYLGYPYFLSGTVIKGKQLGRTIGFPTANLGIEEPYKLIPKKGVYIVYATIGGVRIYGMMNIGTNPTVQGKDLSVEIFFLDFNDDLYGAALQVFLLARLRDEQKFESVDALKYQLRLDEESTRDQLLRHGTPN